MYTSLSLFGCDKPNRVTVQEAAARRFVRLHLIVTLNYLSSNLTFSQMVCLTFIFGCSFVLGRLNYYSFVVSVFICFNYIIFCCKRLVTFCFWKFVLFSYFEYHGLLIIFICRSRKCSWFILVTASTVLIIFCW
jgi:hypothetical protein